MRSYQSRSTCIRCTGRRAGGVPQTRRVTDQQVIRRGRQGFVLLGTLWVIVAIAAITLAINGASEQFVLGARNRMNARVAYWDAQGCLARARAQLNNVLERTPQPQAIWDSLDTYLADMPCQLTARPAGVTLNVNRASEAAIWAVAVESGIAPAVADSAVAVIRASRVRGAFTSWEALHDEPTGLLQMVGLDSLLGVDSARVYVGRAPRPVISGAMIDTRSPGTAQGLFLARTPDAWWIQANASHGVPSVNRTVAIRVLLLGRQLVVEDTRQ